MIDNETVTVNDAAFEVKVEEGSEGTEVEEAAVGYSGPADVEKGQLRQAMNF